MGSSAGGLLWQHENSGGFGALLVKYVRVGTLLFGPYLALDSTASHRRASDRGRINMEAGWWFVLTGCEGDNGQHSVQSGEGTLRLA